MAKEPTKLDPSSAARRVRARRSLLSIRGQSLRAYALELAASPSLGARVLIALAASIVACVAVVLTRESPLVAPGQVMHETRLVRVPFSLTDQAETERRREQARQRVPRVLVLETERLAQLLVEIERLPDALGGVSTLDDVDAGLRASFGLDEASLAALTAVAADEAALSLWRSRCQALSQKLRASPLLDERDFRQVRQSGLVAGALQLREDGTIRQTIDRGAEINLGNQTELASAMRRLVVDAGFELPASNIVTARLLHRAAPLYRYDPSLTLNAEDAQAAAVQPVERVIPVGATIFTRGQRLDRPSYDVFVREMREFRRAAGWNEMLPRRLGLAGAVVSVALLIAGYIAVFCRGIARSVRAVAWVAGGMVASLVIACVVAVAQPSLMVLAVLLPTLVVTTLLCVASGQRVALGLASLLAVLLGIALDQSIGMLTLLLIGIGVAVWQLREIREWGSLLRMGFVLAAALGLGAFGLGLVERPLANPAGGTHTFHWALVQTAGDAALASISGIGVGAIALFMVPLTERSLGVTTGITLIRLRDPRNPLLREVQRRAPGTYNHSLNVASIAEAAADAIDADSLLTYVGALYHDLGKINKPDYFIENQSGGANRHDKLSPAMSLLVIIGHVKDGVEMAREYGLPHPLIHFIEAHHGTTLIEYFFHRAKRIAGSDPAADDGPPPEELDFRYPGPKPRTKEVAILMLADAVESAARSLSEPTPGRIEQLVHDIAQKRLADGQFNDCDLTLRELHVISMSISRSVAAIHHGRIQYPSDRRDRAATDAAKPDATKPEARSA